MVKGTDTETPLSPSEVFCFFEEEAEGKEEEERLPPEGGKGTGDLGREAEEEEEPDLRLLLAKVFLPSKASHCFTDQSLHKSHVESDEHLWPLHLLQVGWGSRKTEDIKAPHFLPPTPGHNL